MAVRARRAGAAEARAVVVARGPAAVDVVAVVARAGIGVVAARDAVAGDADRVGERCGVDVPRDAGGEEPQGGGQRASRVTAHEYPPL